MTNPAQRAAANTQSRPKVLSQWEIDAELEKCAQSAEYFIGTYCQIYDNESKSWIPFGLWDAQIEALNLALNNQHVLALKARQLGLTWLWALALSLWKMRFQPISEILLFSQGEVEALELLSEQRMRGMYSHLPDWMKIDMGSADSKSEFRLSNGSGARALPPTRGGDSRTVTDLVVDEADLIPNLSQLLARAEPTVGRNGNILLIGRADKSTPNSTFKKMYAAAKRGDSEYKTIFIPWFAHPERTQEWYEKKKVEFFSRDGSYDELYAQYPATDTEALQARSLDKRYSPEWINAISSPRTPMQPLPLDCPPIPGLLIFQPPVPGRKYGIGTDSSGGLTDGDDAVSQVVDAETNEQCAVLAGKFEPEVLGEYTADLAAYYNDAAVLPELNNHGLTTLKTLQKRGVTLRNGINRRGDTGKAGWLTTAPSKNMLYDIFAKVCQDLFKEAQQSGQGVMPIIFDYTTAAEVASIDIDTLSAPEGQHDDRSVAFVLAQMCVYRGASTMEVGKHNRWKEDRPAPAMPAGTGKSMITPQAPAPWASPPPQPGTQAYKDEEIRRILHERGITGGGRW